MRSRRRSMVEGRNGATVVSSPRRRRGEGDPEGVEGRNGRTPVSSLSRSDGEGDREAVEGSGGQSHTPTPLFPPAPPVLNPTQPVRLSLRS